MGFLERIVAATRAEVTGADYLRGLPTVGAAEPPSLRRAVQRAGPNGALLAEYKRRSPGATAPVLAQPPMEEFIAGTGAAEVDAYSCVASRPEFGGSPTDVSELAGRTSRPVLFKDFVIDPIQIEAAARAGASAVLLIARLEVEGWLATSLRVLAEAAHDRGLEVLLEWHERTELRRTEDVPADVYGVNVRDLDTLKIRRAVGQETIRAAGAFRPLLGMSGIDGPSDARRFWDAGVDGILVGTALARAPDPRTFLETLRRPASEGSV
jgi:indole-3-glycerol phosphate synthase